MINQVYGTLPDDRPITSLCVVENVEKCPKGFYAVAKSHDHDDDANLWRESGFFGRKVTRYLCLSKTEGTADRVVEAIAVVSEKEKPPEGFTVVSKTHDTGQKAWRKKRLCYKAGHSNTSLSSVTDIILLSRGKKPPEEFTFCGVISGMTVCQKVGKRSHQPPLIIPHSIKPTTPGPDYINTPISPYPAQDNIALRKAPAPPPPKPYSTYATISGFAGLEGVPFVLNSALKLSTNGTSEMPVIKPKTGAQIDKEFAYDFRTEREVRTN